jgi:hypothetical protein
MSFKLLIYYCALCGGWAALAAWGLAFGADLTREEVSKYTSSALTAGLLGVFVAAGIAFLDSLQNDKGVQRCARVLTALIVGLIGGLLGGLIGETLHDLVHVPRFFGWMLVGLAIGDRRFDRSVRYSPSRRQRAGWTSSDAKGRQRHSRRRHRRAHGWSVVRLDARSCHKR